MTTFALFIWPLAALIVLRSLPRAQALIWTALSGYLFLPEAFSIDLPGLPPVSKYSVISGTLLLMALVAAPSKAFRGQTEEHTLVNANPFFRRILIALLALLFLSPILTILTNRAPLVFGPTVLEAMAPWDFFSTTLDTLITVAPFLLARLYLATPEAHRELLKAIAISGLVYSVLMLVEIRISPQLHNWVYGYYQHSFAQHIRGGDFRPMVFLRHGLWVGMFMVMATLAAFSLARGRDGKLWCLAGFWLLVVLFLSSNLGATILAVIFVPLLFLGSTMRTLTISSVAIIFLLYPVMRSSELIPVEAIEAGAAKISEERAASLAFRLRNEDALLERAWEKPLAGWGGYGRNRIFNERGADVSVTDGLWIIQFGTGGWLRYIGFFGLLTLPLLLLRRTRRRKEISVETMTLGLILAANLIYIIPNSALSPIGWMMAGALAGFIQYDLRKTEGLNSDSHMFKKRLMHDARYSRFPQRFRRANKSHT